MTFEEFVNTYNGKAIDYDGGCGIQCVDLAKLYLDKVLGIKIGAIGNAEAYWNRYPELSVLNTNFKRIVNTPEFIPQKGDIAVWGLKHGKYGHIAICDGKGGLTYFYSYDQNWTTKPMHRVKHTYKSGFEGVLRPIIKHSNKFKAGDRVKVSYKDTGARQGIKKLIEVEGSTINKQFWIQSDILSGIIAYAGDNKYIVDLGNNLQMWINEEKLRS